MLDNWRLPNQIRKKNVKPAEKRIDSKINIENIKECFKDCADVNYKDFTVGNEEFYLVYIENMVDLVIIDDDILKPLLNGNMKESKYDKLDLFGKIEKGLIPHIATSPETDVNKLIMHILNGNLCLINKNNDKKAITFDVKKVEKRNIMEPSNENIIKGSKEAFIENIKVNVSLIRNRIKTTDLKTQEFKLGQESPTTVIITYLDSVVDVKVLDELKKRLNNIKAKKIVSLGDLEEQLVEKRYSMFPQIVYTEKTDKFAANILDGKIGIFVDGSPISYIVPALFNMFFQAPEDYSTNYVVASILRILRHLCLAITLITPAFFVSVTTFHQEMIPTELALSIIKSKQGEPFPTLVELVFMLLAFEILIEASTRLPKTIGQAVSIVGGLIIGEAAVNASLVSPSLVVVIAITGIAGFVIPNQDFANAIRVTRFLLLVLSGIAGLYGMAIGSILVYYYLSTMESFGVPYLVPYNATDGRNVMTDSLIRMPIQDMEKGSNKNIRR
jgi:spore germination protein KA